MIKYLGSKRRLAPTIDAVIGAGIGHGRVLDLFTGTTRVAQALKRSGQHVTALDSARYAEMFARCYIETDADRIDRDELADALAHLQTLPGVDGYVTETFCQTARYFQPFNGRRIDAIRSEIERSFANHHLYPILLTSLLEAADRVDSTTGLQMAFVKSWAPRSYRELELRAPELLAGAGVAIGGDAGSLVPGLGSFEAAYLDPPYNQHRYFTNYHVWETLVAWDAPDHYGIAAKRIDARDPATHSPFNSKRTMPTALRQVVDHLDAGFVVLSYNDESWLSFEQLEAMFERWAAVATLAVPSRRYVGAQIGVFNPSGERVGHPTHLHNHELLVLAGERRRIEAGVAAALDQGATLVSTQPSGSDSIRA